MDFIDIFQKLLPFTYSRNSKTFFGTSGMEGSDWIITIAFILLVSIFVIKVLSLCFFGGRRDKQRLNNLLKALENSSSDIDGNIEKIDDSNINSAWSSFKKGLINDDRGLLRVYDADYYFNKRSLLEKVGANSLANIPSLLLSLGLLGTFIGLFYGLVQLNLDDAVTLKESMRTLIHASGAKFASSIWGLGLSIIFGFLLRHHETKVEQLIHKIQIKINESFTLQLSEQSLISNVKSSNNILELLDKNLPYLNKLEEISNIQEKQREALQSMGMNIATNLQKTLADSILAAMSEALKSLEKNIGGTAEDTLHGRITQMSGGIGDEFTVQLKEIMDSLNKQINESIGQDTINLKSAITDLNTTLDHFKTNLHDQNSQITKLISSLEERIDAQGQSAIHTTEAITQNATEAGSKIATALTPINDSIKDIGTLNMQLMKLLEQVTSFNNSTENLKNTASNTNQASAKLSSSVQGLNSSFTDFSGVINNSNKNLIEIPRQLSELVNKSDGIANNTQITYETLFKSHQDLIKANDENIKNLESSLNNYHELISNHISQSMNKIDEGLEENLNKYLQNINDYQVSADQNIQKTLSVFDGRLAEFAKSLASAVEELNSAIDILTNKLS